MSSGFGSYSWTISQRDFVGTIFSRTIVPSGCPITIVPVSARAACMYWNARDG